MRKSLFFLFFFCVINTYSQIGPPCPSPPCLPTGPGLPIDGGISFLIAAGIAYGYKKLKEEK
ncbi:MULTISPECIES: PID-CTERM protein-sorting domain-containing protein [Tenacibaculum]|uniref:PID-CTERM protein-sorting domain-containing protein n=1 Tax=Tenacibaculum TaxID=104267 RepID=UPI001F0AA487|nr:MULTISPECIES: hypothetical protein [Tenacibaculum]MCH3881635.1 hypothetical protein [Tenacibaculum aquimarinum]MDO6598780.1 hypothetical protein [Tenacibaculum sp. 1_MG-2023]